jgi:hypothetical protein
VLRPYVNQNGTENSFSIPLIPTVWISANSPSLNSISPCARLRDVKAQSEFASSGIAKFDDEGQCILPIALAKVPRQNQL